MANASVKQEAQRLVDRLPENATWEDIQYEIYVRQAVEAGLEDSWKGRTVSLEEARRRFGFVPWLCVEDSALANQKLGRDLAC